MLQVIKWEFVKQYHRLKWFFLFFAVFLLFLALLPASWFETETYVRSSILMLFSLILIIGLLGLAVYPMYNMISDFRRKTYTMERITGRSHVPVFFAKTITNLAVISFANGIVYTGGILMDRFSTETTRFFKIPLNPPYLEVTLDMGLLYPAILLFCYMVASTNHYFQNYRKLGTFIGVIASALIGSTIHLSGPVYYIVGLIVGIVLIIPSGRLADQRFEQHIHNL